MPFVLMLSAQAGFADPPESEPAKPWLGVILGDAVDGGVELVALVSDGPAARAGLKKGDVVIRAAERYLADAEDFEEVLGRLRPGDSLQLQLLRAGVAVDSRVELAARPGLSWSVYEPAPPAPVSPVPPPAATIVPDPSAYGLRLTDVTADLRRYFGAPEESGVLVTGVAEGRPAAAAGIRVGDVLVGIGDKQVRRAADVDRLVLRQAAVEDEIELSVVREKRGMTIKLAVPDIPTPTIAGIAADAPRAREQLARSLEREILRLERRIEELRERRKALLENP